MARGRAVAAAVAAVPSAVHVAVGARVRQAARRELRLARGEAAVVVPHVPPVMQLQLPRALVGAVWALAAAARLLHMVVRLRNQDTPLKLCLGLAASSMQAQALGTRHEPMSCLPGIRHKLGCAELRLGCQRTLRGFLGEGSHRLGGATFTRPEAGPGLVTKGSRQDGHSTRLVRGWRGVRRFLSPHFNESVLTPSCAPHNSLACSPRTGTDLTSL